MAPRLRFLGGLRAKHLLGSSTSVIDMMHPSPTASRYRSLSSVAKDLLPRAQRMHRKGAPWAEIARELGVSESVIYIWRKLGQC